MLAKRGIEIISWFPGLRGDNLEHLGVLDLTKRKQRTLDSLFGASNLVLTNVTAQDQPKAQVNRNHDYSPWNGGDNIVSNDWACTSGIGITYRGGSYMLTASHCFVPGWSVYNGGLSGSSNAFMGTEASRDVTNGGVDTALLSMPVLNHIWTGVIGHAKPAVVAGFTTNPLGDVVYNEGAFSGQVADKVISDFPNNGGCLRLEYEVPHKFYRKECHLVEAVAHNSVDIASQSGDSGGPIIRYVNGQLMVTGIVSAGGGDDVSCQYNPTICKPIVYYTAMTYVMWNEYPGACIVDTNSCGSKPTPTYSEATGDGPVNTWSNPNGPSGSEGPTLSANTDYQVVCYVSATPEGPSQDPYWYRMATGAAGYYGSADAFCDEGSTTCPNGFGGTPPVDTNVPPC
jgi:hypothetical protein